MPPSKAVSQLPVAIGSPFHYSPPHSPFLNLVHIDTDLILVDKPAGLLSVPGRLPEHQDSVTTRLAQIFQQALVCHRLDLDTQGLLLFAKNKAAQRSICTQFEKRVIQKQYLALVAGTLIGSGIISMPLCCDWQHRPLQKVALDGKQALTYYQSLMIFKDCSLIRLAPLTGRSHQLRVHLAAIHHPILGDRFYAHCKAANCTAQLCLAATKISLKHPHLGHYCTYTLPGYEQHFIKIGSRLLLT